VFAAQLSTTRATNSLTYAIFPCVIWAALRMGPRGAATVTLAAVFDGRVTWQSGIGYVVAQILGQAQVRTTHKYQQAEVERLRVYLDAAVNLRELEG